MILPPPLSTLFPYTTLFRSPHRQRETSDHPAEQLGGSPLRQRLERSRAPIGACHSGWSTGQSDKPRLDRKSTRLNSSHRTNSYAVFCLKKKKTHPPTHTLVH